jgi:hypothetical protein
VHLKNKPPVFVPAQFQDELEKMSKAMLMDMVWDFAKQNTPADDDGHEASNEEVMETLRGQAEIIRAYR